MKNLFKIYLFIFIGLSSGQCLYARRLTIANIAKPLKPDSAYTTIGVDATFDTGGTQANAVPVPIGTPGYTDPSASQLAQQPRTTGCILDISYMEFGNKKTLSRVVSSCGPFHKRCNSNDMISPAIFDTFTNSPVQFTFTNSTYKTFWQCYTMKPVGSETKTFTFSLGAGYDPIYLLIDNSGVKQVKKEQMDYAIANRNCH